MIAVKTDKFTFEGDLAFKNITPTYAEIIFQFSDNSCLTIPYSCDPSMTNIMNVVMHSRAKKTIIDFTQPANRMISFES